MLFLLTLLVTITRCTSLTELTCAYFKGELRESTVGRGKAVHLCRENGVDYEIPNAFIDDLEALELESGSTMIQIHGVQANKQSHSLEILSDKPYVEVIHQQDRRLSVPRTTGQRTLMVVRVISDTGVERLEPSLSMNHLKKNIFGDPTFPNRANFKKQYSLCSGKKLVFNPATHNRDSSGVVNLVMKRTLKNLDFTINLENEVNKAFEAEYGSASRYDHVMFCLPRGMNGEFLAYALVNDNHSYFSDPWCGSLSATMHEIAHNLGMSHSGEYGEEEYDDESCLLGVGYETETTPLKCFNAQKMWAFNWWPEQSKRLNPIADGAWKGNLAAFVDVDSTSKPVVLRVGNLYVSYNRAKKYNYQVNEKANMITIVQASSSKSISSMLAGIDDSPGNKSFSWNSKFQQGTFRVTIEVCKIVKAVGSAKVDYAELSIRKEGTPSGCARSNTNPTLRKTSKRPTRKPSERQTIRKTLRV